MPLLIMKEFKGKIVSLLQNLWRLYEEMVDCIFILWYNYYVLWNIEQDKEVLYGKEKL